MLKKVTPLPQYPKNKRPPPPQPNLMCIVQPIKQMDRRTDATKCIIFLASQSIKSDPPTGIPKKSVPLEEYPKNTDPL